MLLLVNVDEEEVFWVLMVLIEHILPEGFFSLMLLPLRAYLLIPLDYIQETMLKLVAHLVELSINLPMISCFSWFLSHFIDCLPIEVCMPIAGPHLCKTC